MTVALKNPYQKSSLPPPIVIAPNPPTDAVKTQGASYAAGSTTPTPPPQTTNAVPSFLNSQNTPSDLENLLGQQKAQSDALLAQQKAQQQKTLNEQALNTNYLQTQNQGSATLQANEAQRNSQQTAANIAGAQASFLTGREGPQSASAPLVVNQYTNTANQLLSDSQTRYNLATQQRAEAERQLKLAQENGNLDQQILFANQIQNLSQQQIKERESLSLMNVQQQASVRANLDSFKTLIDTGVALDTPAIQAMASQLGVPTDMALNYNQGAQAIRDSKTLDNQQKQAQINILNQQFQDAVNGIKTAEAQNLNRFQKLKNSGLFSESELNDFARTLNINLSSLPENQAKIAKEQAEATIEQVKAKYAGKEPPPNTEDYWNMKKAEADAGQAQFNLDQAKGIDTSNNISIPNEPVETIAFNDQKVTAQPRLLTALEQADAAMFAATGQHIQVTSSNRSYADQEAIRKKFGYTSDSQPSGYNGLPPAAPPGQSFHEKGLAVDIKNWQEAKQYLNAAGIQGGGVIPNDPGHFSIGELGIKKPDYKQYGLLANTDFNPNNPIDSKANLYLQSYIKNASLPSARALGLSTAKGSTGQFAQIAARANDLYFAATGSSLPDISLLSGNKDLINANNKLENNLNIQEDTIGKNFALAISNIDKAGLNQHSQPVNAFLDKMSSLWGSPQAAQYLAQNETLQNEAASLLALKNASGTTVGDKLAAAGLVPVNASEEQQKAILKTLLKEAENAHEAIKGASADIYKKIDPLEQLTDNPNRQLKISNYSKEYILPGAPETSPLGYTLPK